MIFELHIHVCVIKKREKKERREEKERKGDDHADSSRSHFYFFIPARTACIGPYIFKLYVCAFSVFIRRLFSGESLSLSGAYKSRTILPDSQLSMCFSRFGLSTKIKNSHTSSTANLFVLLSHSLVVVIRQRLCRHSSISDYHPRTLSFLYVFFSHAVSTFAYAPDFFITVKTKKKIEVFAVISTLYLFFLSQYFVDDIDR